MTSARLESIGRLRRDPAMVRVAVAFTAFSVTYYGGTIAVLVYAYGQGGVREAGVVGVLFVLPTVVAAPAISYAGDRFRRDRVMAVGYLLQAAVSAAVAIAMLAAGPALIVYVAAALWNIAISMTRPGIGSILPLLADTPEALSSANVALGLLEAGGAIIGPAVAGLLMGLYEPGTAFAAFAAVMLCATALQSTVRIDPDLVLNNAPNSGGVFADVLGGLTFLRSHPDQRLIVTLVGLVWIVIGALDVGFAAVAVEILGENESVAGYLSMAVGIGGLLGASASVLLVGRRRLTPAIALGSAVMVIPVVVMVNISGLWLALAAMVVLGVGYRLSLIAGRTLLQGSTPDDVLARIFGVLEGLNMLSVALGALLVLVLEPVLGLGTTLVLTGLVYPVTLAVTARRLAAIDATRPQLDPDLIALLRTVPIFAPLSAYQIEQLALTAEHSTADDGDVVIVEGDPGSTAYVIADGRVAISRRGEPVARAGKGEYFGEIALLRETPRTATVEAVGPVELIGFRRDEFLAAVTGCRRALVLAHRTADQRRSS